MPDESIFREKAREAIRSGRPPTTKPDRTFGGPGSAPCYAWPGPIPSPPALLRGLGTRAHKGGQHLDL